MPETNSDDVLEKIWEDAEVDTWGYHLYNFAKDDRPTELYVTSPDGKCWKVIAQKHPHSKE